MSAHAPAAASALIRIRGLSKSYRRGTQEIPVLIDLDLAVMSGEFVALMGPSGSGKSTLLNLIAGIDTPTRGSIEIGGVDIASLSDSALADWRARHIGFIFQFYNLLPVLSARENVELPLLLTTLSARERAHRADEALALVGLSDRADHRPSELSGGQAQRVAIARALVTEPTLIVADEPTGDLDRTTGDEVLKLMESLVRDYGKTLVMVTHDPRAASRAQRMVHLEKGVLTAAGAEGGLR
ncbi:MAG: ABC transporter ATP-binding protein [Comamonadaceae bacterium]|nr:MAG: ABC transporter ATP-binding protein [Comamonadaceae bacterium]